MDNDDFNYLTLRKLIQDNWNLMSQEGLRLVHYLYKEGITVEMICYASFGLRDSISNLNNALTIFSACNLLVVLLVI